MLNVLEYALNSRWTIICTTIVVSIVFLFVVRSSSRFFLLYILLPQIITLSSFVTVFQFYDSFDIYTILTYIVILLFVVVLTFYYGNFIFNISKTVYFPDPDCAILSILVFKTLLFIYVLYASNFTYGLLSQGSRLDYYFDNPYLIKLLYIDQLFDFLIIFLCFKSMSRSRFLKYIFFLFLTFFIDLFSGSKGFFVQIAIAIFLLVYGNGFGRLRAIHFLAILMVLCLAVYVTALVNDLSFADYLDLIANRYILYADSTLISFDQSFHYYIQTEPYGNIFSELFRNIGNLLNFNKSDQSLGLMQYRFLYGDIGNYGSTNQLSAMFITYANNPESIPFSLFTLFFIVALFHFFRMIARSPYILVRSCAIAMLFYLVINFAQGFDAFSQSIPVYLIIVLLAYFISLSNFGPNCKCQF